MCFFFLINSPFLIAVAQLQCALMKALNKRTTSSPSGNLDLDSLGPVHACGSRQDSAGTQAVCDRRFSRLGSLREKKRSLPLRLEQFLRMPNSLLQRVLCFRVARSLLTPQRMGCLNPGERCKALHLWHFEYFMYVFNYCINQHKNIINCRKS